ncbi:MAG: hypothetical protein J6W29_01370, partial [Neisseriaceae bacterium]|nr:hypothetical protein [Neisseriaceae bacterium]
DNFNEFSGSLNALVVIASVKRSNLRINCRKTIYSGGVSHNNGNAKMIFRLPEINNELPFLRIGYPN